MPRDANGNYSLPAGYKATTGQTIQVSQHNPPLEDLAAAVSNALDRTGATPLLADMDMGGHKITNVAPGVAPTDVATVGQLTGAGGSGTSIPAGIVFDFFGTTCPSGFIWANGQAVSRTTYPNLFAAIGTTFGAGDGSTTFAVPDLRGRATLGIDGMGSSRANRVTTATNANPDSVGSTSGWETLTLTAANLPSHTHSGATENNGAHTHTATVSDPGHTHTVSGFARTGTSNDNSSTTIAQMQGGNVTGTPSTTAAATGITVSIAQGGLHAHTFTTGGGNGLTATPVSKLPPVMLCSKIITAS